MLFMIPMTFILPLFLIDNWHPSSLFFHKHYLLHQRNTIKSSF